MIPGIRMAQGDVFNVHVHSFTYNNIYKQSFSSCLSLLACTQSNVQLYHIYPMKPSAEHSRAICTHLLITEPFTIAKPLVQPSCLSRDAWIKKNTYFHVLCHGMDAKYLHGVMCLNTWCLVGDAVCEGAEVLRRQSLSGGRRPPGVGFRFSIVQLHFLYHALLLHRLCSMAAGPPDSDFWPSPTWRSILLWNCELK